MADCPAAKGRDAYKTQHVGKWGSARADHQVMTALAPPPRAESTTKRLSQGVKLWIFPNILLQNVSNLQISWKFSESHMPK